MNRKTIREIAAAWKEYKRPYVKRSTLAAYLLILDKHILPDFGDAAELEDDVIQAFVLRKLDSGLCVKSVKDILVVLKMLMRFGVKNRWMDYCDWDIKYPAEKQERGMEILTVSNHRKILKYVQDHFSFLGLGIFMSLTTGMRIGEICGLKWKDIDVNGGIITIARTIERIYIVEDGARYSELVINTPKTRNSCREIPMSRDLISMVKPLKKVFNENFYVLANSDRPIEPRTYRNHYKRFMDRLDIPALKYHGLRHSFATRCIEAGCDYKTVSALLGHSNISTTMDLYVHPDMAQKKRCIEKVVKSLSK